MTASVFRTELPARRPSPTPASMSPNFSRPDAEAAVLGSMLMEREAIVIAKGLLEESSFESVANRRVFRAMLEVAGTGSGVDPITLEARLEDNGDLESAGGHDRIVLLLDEVPTAANVEHYARIVFEAALRRRTRDLAEQVIREIGKDGIEPSRVVAWYRTELEAIALQYNNSAGIGLPVYDDEELAALPAPQWDVPGVIPRNGLVQIHGPYGSGKTFVALDMLFHRSLGLSWHGLQVAPGPAFYIVAEGATGMRARVAGLKKYSGVDRAGLFFIPQPVVVNNDAQVDQLIAVIKAKTKEDDEPWVVLDTRTRCFVGNENSTEDMQAFVRGCARIQREVMATVIVLHHPGWGNEERGRGAYDFDASCDTIIRIERDAERVTLSCGKQKDGPDFAPLAFEMVPVSQTLVLRAVELSSGKLTGQRLTALRTLHQNSTDLGWTYKAWLDASSLKPSSFNKARDWLNTQGYVKSSGGKWKVTDAGYLAFNSTDSTATTPGLHS